MALSTGHGATLTFDSNTVSIISMSGFEQSREALDTSHLGTTDYRTKIPGDLAEPGEFTVEFFFDPTAAWSAVADEVPPIEEEDVAETCTVILPISVSGNNTNAQWTGNGFITNWTTPELVTDSLMTSSVTIQWADGPTFSEEAA